MADPIRDGFVVEVARAQEMLKAALTAYAEHRVPSTVIARLRSARRHIWVAKGLLEKEFLE